MKLKRILCLVVILLLAFGSCVLGANPRRYATKVDDVFKPYTADEMIVSDTEEPRGDQTTDQVIECDIKSAIACYDRDYLRVDILLHNSVSDKWQVFYAIKFQYSDMIEYYTYYPDTDEVIYELEENGKITEHKILDLKKSNDQAGVTSSGDIKNNDIYFIINKEAHIAGVTGKRYFLTTSFYAGYVTKKDTMEIADSTIAVEMEFVK